jgi:elongation factor Ts
MAITSELVKQLREMTGIGMMKCKEALEATDGDLEKAVEHLRKKGLATADKKAGRATNEGCIACYIDPNGKIGVLLEVKCETDFAARSDDVRQLCRDLCAQIAANKRLAIGNEDAAAAMVEKEREVCQERVKGIVAKLGENISVNRFTHYEIGESEGCIASYIHSNAKIGVLIEVQCKTDSGARSDDLRQLSRDLCMQIAATKPLGISKEDIPAATIEKEREIYGEQVKDKPAQIIEKIVDGKLQAFFKERCLLEQPFVKDPKTTVGDLLKSIVAKLGENLSVTRFVRFEIGE